MKNRNMETWRQIRGYEGIYDISSLGRVKSLRRREHSDKRGYYVVQEKVLKPISNGKGYLGVILTKNGEHEHYYIHRLVAEAFIPNPKNYPQINHKNEDKSDNSCENLEWCTSLYNMNYGNTQERKAEFFKKKVAQYSLDGKLIAIYDSITEAAKQNGFLVSPISNCFVGRYKTSYGFIWKPI